MHISLFFARRRLSQRRDARHTKRHISRQAFWCVFKWVSLAQKRVDLFFGQSFFLATCYISQPLLFFCSSHFFRLQAIMAHHRYLAKSLLLCVLKFIVLMWTLARRNVLSREKRCSDMCTGWQINFSLVTQLLLAISGRKIAILFSTTLSVISITLRFRETKFKNSLKARLGWYLD